MNARSLSGINDVTSNGDVALTMNARSMSGINDTFGGGGDVFLAGNPNTFTGTNTFNTNRPTSDLDTTPGTDDFITKSDGQSLFTNNTGDALLAGGTEASPQTFTEFNKFDKLTKFEGVRPQLVATDTTTNATDYEFITKQDGDELYGSLSGSARLAGGDEDDPQIFTGENLFEADIVFEGGIEQKDTGSANLLSQVATGTTLNIFSQTGIPSTINSITQVGANSTFNTDGSIQASGNITTEGKIGVGLGGNTPTCALDVEGVIKLRKGTAFIYVDDFQQSYQNAKVAISGNATSYFALGNGGHHIDTYTTGTNAGRRMYINWYADQPVTLRKTSYVSDDRLKVDEKFIENATATLMKLRPQTYMKYPEVRDISMIRPNFDVSGSFESGLIAQEIYYDAPELRHLVDITDLSDNKIIPSSDDPQKDPDYSDWGDMPTSVDYIGLIAYIIKSNQELHQRISILEVKINNM